jgi:hypothetical protein
MDAAVAVHDYDPVSDAAVSWRLTPGASVTQQITLPPGVPLRGMAVKLRRLDSTSPLRYRLGSAWDRADLAQGVIAAEVVGQWFERWTWIELPGAPQVPSSGQLFLQVHLAGADSGSYEWFGTATELTDRPELRIHFGYAPAWSQTENARPPTFENPMNLDYGAATPCYRGGVVLDQDGHPVAGLSLAFRVEGAARHADDGEERFAFADEISGPLFTRSLRRRGVVPADGELALDDGWASPSAPDSRPVAERAVAEFTDFLRIAMECPLRGDKPFRLTLDPAARLPDGEAFELDVTKRAVTITARSEQGIMHALHYAEALMRLRRAPILPLGRHVRRPRWPARITCAAFGTRRELTGPVDAYSDELLARTSRAGCNGIWMLAELGQLGRSAIYPELDDRVAERQQRLADLVARTARYGIGVYVYLESHPQPDAFFDRHPATRGSTFHAYGGTAVCCAAVPDVQRHIRSSVADLVNAVPQLAGLIVNVGGEGFLHCHTRTNDCPRCRSRPAHEAVAQLVATITDAVHAANPAITVAAWPYSASNWWSAADPTQSGLIARLPPDATLLTEFAKEGQVSVGTHRIPAYDYPISILGPSGRFAAQHSLAQRHGLRLWAKTEHAIALEFITTPYIPAFAQWVERFNRIAAAPRTSGIVANWMHYGFMPGRASDLLYWAIWDGPHDPDTLLRDIAVRDFGDAAAERVLHAWHLFSQAIRDYPFSGPMALGPIQSGPAHPLFLDSSYRPWHGAERQFRNDLSWTEPWGPQATLARLHQLAERWARGIAELRAAADFVAAEDRPDLEREVGIAVTLLACVRSTIHVGEFYLARARLTEAAEVAGRRAIVDELTRIAEAEHANCTEVLTYIQADSRLGYANSADSNQQGVPRGGLFSPGSVAKKLAHLDRLLRDDLPALRAGHASTEVADRR